MTFSDRAARLLLFALFISVAGCNTSKASSEALESFPDPKAALVADAVLADDGPKATSLVKSGADPSAVGKDGRSLLEFACFRSKHGAFDALLAAGADTTHADDAGDTVMHYAAANADSAYLMDLLAKKTDPNMVNKSTGYTPLMAAALADRGPQVQALIAAHADLNVAASNGDTALIVAAEAKANARVLELLNAGADPRARDVRGHTFQKFLYMTPENVRSAESKAQLSQINAWLTAHQIPIES